jgi:hypothetical protein
MKQIIMNGTVKLESWVTGTMAQASILSKDEGNNCLSATQDLWHALCCKRVSKWNSGIMGCMHLGPGVTTCVKSSSHI